MSFESRASSPSRTTILPLAPDVAARIKSTATITSLNQVIDGLVENSLDANACFIEIEVHYGRGSCVVEDDGQGIPPAEFTENGGLAKMYHTSKADAPEYTVHGSSGTFLASLTSLSLLSVSSRQRSYRYPSSITFHQGSSIARSVHRNLDEHSAAHKHGARVVVRDLFGMLPVRVKQRAALAEDKAQRDRLWEELKRNIISLILAWDKPVSIRMKTVDDARFCTFRYPKQLLWASSLSESSAVNPGYAAAVYSFLLRADLIAADTQSSWIPASASSRLVTVKGIICRNPTPTKRLQFLSLGVRPFTSKVSGIEFLEHINKLFSQSDFGWSENGMEPNEADVEQRRKDKRFKPNVSTMKQLRSANKGVERHPMFYLAIRLKDGSHTEEYDKLEGGTGSLFRSILDVLDALVTGWLTTNEFVVRGSRQTQKPDKEDDQPSMSPSQGAITPLKSFTLGEKDHAHVRTTSSAFSVGDIQVDSVAPTHFRLSSRPKSPFHEYSRIKSGSKSTAVEIQHTNQIESCCSPVTSLQAGQLNHIRPNSTAKEPTVEADTTPGDSSDLAGSDGNPYESAEPEDETFVWEDPFSREKFRLNSRTGQALFTTKQSRISGTTPSQVSATDQQFHKPITLSRTKTTLSHTGNSSSILGDVLRSWQSPIFKATEQSIRHAGFDPPTKNGLAGDFITEDQIEKAFSEGSISYSSKLSKLALKDAVVISQVDKKFILIAMEVANEPAPDTMLVLVDQHAMDERIRLENLFAELVASTSTQPPIASDLGLQSRIQYTLLTPPIVFESSTPEARLFHSNTVHFADWGILLDVDSKAIITIHTVPSVIAERCKLQPMLLISLVRSEAWKLNDSGPSTAASQPLKGEESIEEEPHWIQRIGKCPQGIIDMLNSRACRSAIMFNDELSQEECVDLITEAAKCAFPFQCAHGRPSMVPLVRLGNIHDFGISAKTASQEQDKSFASAYRDWRLD